METGLKDKVALVTGAGSQIGFGKAIAEALAREGCHVLVNDIDLEGARQTAREIEALGRRSLAIKADVTSAREVDGMFRQATAAFGGIDILVNNAGACTPPKAFLEMTEEEWNSDININLNGTMHCTRAAASHMIARRKGGKIVNLVSGAGINGGFHTAAYAAAKAGIIAFSMGIAKELAPEKINVNNVSPGPAITGFARNAPPGMLENFAKTIPIGRLTEPGDIAGAVVFLASDAAGDIVGQTLVVTGSVSP
ncbi:MAG: glucose 1-dehydrogenase [Dehalococcoidales bacterium]|nr:glucose 1-dehydrogenase [Dehalococcoidales bacterium]